MTDDSKSSRTSKKAPPDVPLFSEDTRFWLMCGLIVLTGFATRIQACDERQIASAVLEDPRISELIPRNDDLARRLEALDQLEPLKGQIDRLQGSQDRLQSQLSSQQQLIQQLIDHSWTKIYTFDPSNDAEPDPGPLTRLRKAVRDGAELLVVHSTADGAGGLVSYPCVEVTIDTNENVLCIATVIPAALSLPDGRRYQSTLRHDGTILFSHWNADGTNIQTSTLLVRRSSAWFVRLPF